MSIRTNLEDCLMECSLDDRLKWIVAERANPGIKAGFEELQPKGQNQTKIREKHGADRKVIRMGNVGNGRTLDVVKILKPVSMMEAQRWIGRKLLMHPHH